MDDGDLAIRSPTCRLIVEKGQAPTSAYVVVAAGADTSENPSSLGTTARRRCHCGVAP
jgi:hypothetical protein